MIAYLSGTLLHKEADKIVIDVEGVGYEVFVPSSTLAKLPDVGQSLRIHIHTHMSDSQLHLYGFDSVAEKQVFKKLMSVSGIGPKLASTMISAMPYGELIQAIVTENIDALKAIGGVGPKTAQRVAIELKDKFKDAAFDGTISRTLTANSEGGDFDVMQALMTLGYSDQQARKALRAVDRSPGDTLQTLIKKSLGTLAP